MKKAFKLVAGLCIVVTCAIVGVVGTEYLLSSQSAARTSGSGEAERTVRVGVTRPEQRELQSTVSAVGTIMPLHSVEIIPVTSGRVTEVAMVSGAEVEEGELLLQLDDRAQRAALKRTQATLDEARQNFERVEELAEANTAAEQRLEQARADLARAEAEVMSARAALEDRRIEAPFSGTLGFVDIDPGAYVSPASTVARLSDLSVLHVDLSLPERHFQRVRPGQTVKLVVPAYPGKTLEGKVTVRDNSVAPGSRSFDVRAEIPNTDRRLVGGMFAQTRLVLETYDGLAVPDDAIISEGASTFVYAIENGRAHRTTVSLGGSTGSLTEVTDGLEADEQIVVTGWDTLRDGSPVEIVEDIARGGLE